MIGKKIEEALNLQVNREMFSAYLYMSMSSFAESIGYKGIANWFMVQYHEEMLHAMKMYEYIGTQGGKVVLEAIEKPQSSFDSIVDIMEQTLEHEKYITQSIYNLMDLAIEEKDHATKGFLDWYVAEQVEEEQNASDNLLKIKMAGDNSGALYVIDKEFETRVVTVPTDFSKGISAALKAAG